MQVTATVALGALAHLAVPLTGAVVPAPGRTFEDLLAGTCAVAALATGAWVWLVITAVVVEALTGARAGRSEGYVGVPRALRTLVLAACGAALVVPTSGAVAAEPPHPLHGLPMPDRATSTAAWVASAVRTATSDTERAEPPGAARTHVVRAGDTLWSLAAADLSPAADDADISRRSHRLHELNRAVIGDDPDLIHPGQRLQLPPAAHRGVQP